MSKKSRLDKSQIGGGGSTEQPMMIAAPLVIMFKQDDRVICHIHPDTQSSYQSYGLLICDLARHVARAYKVEEADVWKWVDMERNHPTTEITQAS